MTQSIDTEIKELINKLDEKLEKKLDKIDRDLEKIKEQLVGIDKRLIVVETKLEIMEGSQRNQIWSLIVILATAVLGILVAGSRILFFMPRS